MTESGEGERASPAGRDFGGLDVRVMKAFSHEIRQRILLACAERAASPSDLADEWGESRAAVAYHVRILHRLSAVELEREERVRGSVKHYYRTTLAPVLEDCQIAQFPVGLRRRIVDHILRQVSADIDAAARVGGFDRPDVHVSRTPLTLDETAYAELSAILREVIDRALALDAESEDRRARGESTGEIRTELAILHFFRP